MTNNDEKILKEKTDENENNISKIKPIIKCIFCEKFEKDFTFKVKNIPEKLKSNTSLNDTMTKKTKKPKKPKRSISQKDITKNSENNNEDETSNNKIIENDRYQKSETKHKKSKNNINIEAKDKNETALNTNNDNTKTKKIKKLKKIKRKKSPQNNSVENNSKEEKEEKKEEEKKEDEKQNNNEENKNIQNNNNEENKKEENKKEEEKPINTLQKVKKTKKSKKKNKNKDLLKEVEIEDNTKEEKASEKSIEVSDNGSGVEGKSSDEEKEEKEPNYQPDEICELPVMLTNIPQKENNETFYKIFNCGHVICYNCIARLIFTNFLNELPSYEDIKINCKCNKGNVEITISELETITQKISCEEENEKICDKHGLLQKKYCLECKKWLCAKCVESHIDLFGENLHHFENEPPPNNNVCKDHPNCFLNTLCNDCHKTICHLCIVEGNKHFCHNTVSFNNLKLNIIKNVENMRYTNYDIFIKEVDKLDKIYNDLHKDVIEKFNEKIENLIKLINEYKDNFINKMKEKLSQKNQTMNIIKNIHEFFFKEFDKIPKSIDYPVLCLYQVFNSEFISFKFETPKINTTFIDKLFNEISLIDDSENYKNKYQFSLKNFVKRKTLNLHINSINSMCYLEDGRLVTGGEDKKIIIWNKNLDKADLILIDNPKPIKVVKLLNDGRLIVGSYKEMKILNNNNFQMSYLLKDISNNVTDIINLDDGRIISASYREIRIFNMTWNSGYKNSKAVKEHTSWVTSLIKLNGKRFASGSEDGQILIFDYNIKCIRKINLKFQISSLCNQINNNIIYDDNTYNNFYIGDNEGRIHLYKFSSQNLVTVSGTEQHTAKINKIIPLFGGNYCTCAQESKLIIHDNDFNPIQIINNNDQNKSVNSVIQMPDGKIVTGNELGIINFYE